MSSVPSLYDPNLLPATQIGGDDSYNNDSAGRFLGRLKLYTGTAGAIQSGKINAGMFGAEARKDDVTPLEASVDIIPFARKRMAIDMSTPGRVVRSYEPNSDAFKRIQKIVDDNTPNSNCQYGTLYLVFERTLGRFLEFFCAPPSWAGEVSEKLSAFMPISTSDISRRAKAGEDVASLQPSGPKACTLTSHLVEKPGRKWHVPHVNRCSTPFVNAPSLEAVQKEVIRFLTAAEPAAEKVAEAGSGRAR